MLKEIGNSKVKGTVGIGRAIQYFTSKGVVVSIPLNDSQGYDLVVEVDGKLQRVQVKTSTSRGGSGESWSIALRTMGGNQSFHTAKDFDKTKCDLLFSMVENGRMWLIPTDKITSKTCITVGHKSWAEYEVVDVFRM